MNVKFDIPNLAPHVAITIRGFLQDAEVRFVGGQDAIKKKWVMDQSLTLLDQIPVPDKVPTWLARGVKTAVLSVVIDTVWALEKDQREHST